MRRLMVTATMTAAFLLVGLLIAEAMTWSGAVSIRNGANPLNLTEVVHCRRWGRCPVGMRLACDERGQCQCIPC